MPRPNDVAAALGAVAESAPAAPAVAMPSGVNPKRCPACSGRYPADFRVCPRDATPLEDAPEGEDPLLGALLGGSYEIVRVIGEGGMGRVYEARHARLPKKRFAVKLLHHELAREPEVVSRFQREAEAASSIVHPNVVGVFDVSATADGLPYLVAELLEGEQLGDYLDRVGKLAPGPAVRIVRQVASALAAAHARGVVHRDMKPENVFLARSPTGKTVKVLDFGISKVAESSKELTKTGMVMGTPAYMGPEQARGERVDHRADVYAVGAILYRALTGRKPFEHVDPMATLTAVLVEEPPRPTTVVESIPASLELVVQKAMAKDPTERHASMEELDADLAPFDVGGSEEGTPPDAEIAGEAARSAPDATAVTMLAGGARKQTSDEAAQAVRLARPAIVLYTVTAFGWATVALVVAIAAVLRWVGGEGTLLTRSEAVLAAIGAFAVLLTPLVLWSRHVAARVWPSSPRSVETAARLRRAVVGSTAVAGAVAMFLHLVGGAGSSGLLPAYDLVLVLAAFGAGAVAWSTGRHSRRSP